jgi:formate dehydrogenase maturation protein FdhE
MKCWHCGTELIWHSVDDVDDSEEYSIVTNLSCPKCNSYVQVYYPREVKSGKD